MAVGTHTWGNQHETSLKLVSSEWFPWSQLRCRFKLCRTIGACRSFKRVLPTRKVKSVELVKKHVKLYNYEFLGYSRKKICSFMTIVANTRQESLGIFYKITINPWVILLVHTAYSSHLRYARMGTMLSLQHVLSSTLDASTNYNVTTNLTYQNPIWIALMESLTTTDPQSLGPVCGQK